MTSEARRKAAELPVVERTRVHGYAVEVVEDRNRRRTKYSARVVAMPGCGMPGDSPTEAIEALEDLLPTYLARQAERIGPENVPTPEER